MGPFFVLQCCFYWIYSLKQKDPVSTDGVFLFADILLLMLTG